jgi:hypothetical protein
MKDSRVTGGGLAPPSDSGFWNPMWKTPAEGDSQILPPPGRIVMHISEGEYDATDVEGLTCYW